MSDHAQGTWEIDEDDLKVHATNPDGTCRCPVAEVWGLTEKEAEANARLIAAAPDLLDACKAALEHMEKTWFTWSLPSEKLRDRLAEAVVKATGGPR